MTERTIDEMRNKLRDNLKTLRVLEKRADKAERMYVRNPESRKYEREFDEAYALQFDCMNKCINLLVKITAGQIDKKTARMMMVTKRRAIEAIV